MTRVVERKETGDVGPIGHLIPRKEDVVGRRGQDHSQSRQVLCAKHSTSDPAADCGVANLFSGGEEDDEHPDAPASRPARIRREPWMAPAFIGSLLQVRPRATGPWPGNPLSPSTTPASAPGTAPPPPLLRLTCPRLLAARAGRARIAEAARAQFRRCGSTGHSARAPGAAAAVVAGRRACTPVGAAGRAAAGPARVRTDGLIRARVAGARTAPPARPAPLRRRRPRPQSRRGSAPARPASARPR